MTVGELIAKLMKFNTDFEVGIATDDYISRKLKIQIVESDEYGKPIIMIKNSKDGISCFESFEENFYWSAAWYNGYEDEFDKLLDYLKDQQNNTNSNTYSILRPDFIKPENEIMELYWMLLVFTFGEYGTSPRSGWIYRDKLDDCINHITEMINKTYGEEALQQCDADQHIEPITVEIYPFTEYGERLNKALRPWEEAAKIYETYKEFDEFQQKIRKTTYPSKLQKELHEKRNNLDYALCLCMQACNDLAESCGIDLGIKFKKYDKEIVKKVDKNSYV